MKTYNHLIEPIAEYQNLEHAYRKSRLGRRYQEEVLRYTAQLEENLVIAKNELLCGTYEVGRYREFYVYDPKTRLVMALPFRDRVIHHAICNVIEPLFDKKFIYDNYACRVGKGTVAGVLRLEQFIKRTLRSWDQVYVLKADIKKYFYSIQHEILKQLIRRTIRCKPTLHVLDHIIDTGGDDGVGIPIGNLTSQLFANIFLNPLDHFIKETLRVKHYVRYMDDFVILGETKEYLWEIYHRVKDFLGNLALTLNKKTSIFPLSRGIDFLGYRHFADHRKLRKRNVQKVKRKFRKFNELYAAGRITRAKIEQSVNSFLAQAAWACGYQQQCSVMSTLCLQRGE